MDAFFFGRREQPLLGLHHPGQGRARRHAILVVPGWGNEQARSHRALHLFAESLAASGFELLRYDPRHCGDSAGESRGLSAASWREDVRSAADELRSLSGSPRLCLLGVRLGALLALQALREGLPAEAAVLIDPPASGAHWLSEQRRLDHLDLARKNGLRPRRDAIPASPEDELMGLALPADFRRLIEASTLAPAPPGVRVLQAQGATQPCPWLEGAERLALPDHTPWNTLRGLYTPWNPQGSLRLLGARLAEWLDGDHGA